MMDKKRVQNQNPGNHTRTQYKHQMEMVEEAWKLFNWGRNDKRKVEETE